MEKISLYDLLSVLLPGAILTLAIKMLIFDLNINLAINNFDIDKHFSLTIFLTTSIFLGSLVNALTWKAQKFIHKDFLFGSISSVYKKIGYTTFQNIKPFFNELHIKLVGKEKSDTYTEKEKISHVWSEIYYELEAKQQIGVPKNFQSFYFFFRNFFTTGLILIIFHLVYFIFTGDYKYLGFLGIDVFAVISSVLAGKWYRKKMIERLFWTYYSLNKK